MEDEDEDEDEVEDVDVVEDEVVLEPREREEEVASWRRIFSFFVDDAA